MNLIKKSKISLLSTNVIRQVLIAAFGLVIPFLVVDFCSKNLWGSFVSIWLYVLFAIQISNWGNKDYLLRKFSKSPSQLKVEFSSILLLRIPILILFIIASFIFFESEICLYLIPWLVGRYFFHSYEVLVMYEKKFKEAIGLEFISFMLFLYLFSNWSSSCDLVILIQLFGFYQLIKGFAYVALFHSFFTFTINYSLSYFSKSFWFFLMASMGFFSSKIDVCIIERFGNKILTSDYQILNSMFIFIMSISAFIYGPFMKNMYRNSTDLVIKIKKLIFYFGLILVPIALVFVYFLNNYFLKLYLGFNFYIIAFFYIMPSFIYGIEIVKLFKQQQEKIVFFILLIGIITNGIVTSILLYNENEITNILLGSAVVQLLVLVLFENINSLKAKIKIIKQKHFYSKFNLKNKLCFDIGANIGYKSSIFASLNAKVIAFEPQSNCIPFLEKIKTKYPNFIYKKIAIGDVEKSTELHIGNHIEIATLSKSFIDFYQTKENTWNTKEIVNVSTLNKMIELYGIPYYCKIDTEGYEWQILNSLSYSIPLIEFEFTEGFFDDTLKIIALFDENLVTFNYILNENTTFKLKNWANKKEIISQLKLLPKNRLHGNLFIKRNDILNPSFKVK